MTRAEFLRYVSTAVTTTSIWRASAQQSNQGPVTLPALSRSVGSASVRTEKDMLIISTGKLERRWLWTGKGLVTISLSDLSRHREWARQSPGVVSDWAYAGLLDDSTEGQLISIDAKSDSDDGFTSTHLAVTVEVVYPVRNISLRYIIWSYPGAEGLRTQLWLKGAPPDKAPSTGGRSVFKRADFIPVHDLGALVRRRYVGYFNDTQHRNTPETELLREEVRSAPFGIEEVDWASFVSLETADAGMILLKESHKCVNQSGVDTGAFILDKSGLQNTGWALSAADLTDTNYRWCWASWVIVHDGTDDGRELALKRFDRVRYPVLAKRDLWSIACTWGNSTSGRDGRRYAAEKEVLPEMKSVASLGIDALLIDSGWQIPGGASSVIPDPHIGWRPSPDIYPDGWKNVIAEKNELGLRIGLWGIAEQMPVADMEWNWDRLRMVQLKLDFAKLHDYHALAELMGRVKEFLMYTGHRCIISWDATENAPRYGYYWAREYGDVHFMNRKPEVPRNAIYIPWLALRDFWQLARYNNLNKWQLPTCNSEIVDPELSDARQYSVCYCTATTLMGIPEFMTITRSYSDKAREELSRLLSQHKAHRKGIFDSYVFAIGEKPSNASWSGFQTFSPQQAHGYLLVFRERLNEEPSRRIAVRFLPKGTSLVLEDIRSGKRESVRLGKDMTLELKIPSPGDFLFLKYTSIPAETEQRG